MALKDPAMIAKLRELGGIPIPGTPADFGKLVADETAKWEKVVHAANLSVNYGLVAAARMTKRKRPEELRSHRWLGVSDLRAFGHRSRLASRRL